MGIFGNVSEEKREKYDAEMNELILLLRESLPNLERREMQRAAFNIYQNWRGMKS